MCTLATWSSSNEPWLKYVTASKNYIRSIGLDWKWTGQFINQFNLLSVINISYRLSIFSSL